MSKLKTYVITLSKHFMATHPKAGQPTNFFCKINQGEKKHTIRGNYDLWKRRINNINEGKALLSIREWSGRPYNSHQLELMQLKKVGIQKLQYDILGWFIDDTDSDLSIEKLAKNDGLLTEDFKSWFKKRDFLEPRAIIHFTDFRY